MPEEMLTKVSNQKALLFVRSYQQHSRERRLPKRLLRHRLPVNMDGDLLDLLHQCFMVDPCLRCSAAEALGHEYFTNAVACDSSPATTTSSSTSIIIQQLPLKPTKSDQELQQSLSFEKSTGSVPRLFPEDYYNRNYEIDKQSSNNYTNNNTNNASNQCASPWDKMEMQSLYPSVDGALSPATLGD